MAPWTGIVLALSEPGDDRMGSRVPTSLYPLAGRPLAWHALSALAGSDPAPARVLLVTDRELSPEPFLDAAEGVEVVRAEAGALWEAVAAAGVEERVLVADARAPLLAGALPRLRDAEPGGVLTDERGRPAAAWLDAAGARRCLSEGGLEGVAAAARAEGLLVLEAEEGVVVRGRRSLARASTRMRDRLVERLMDGGVTFLLPETSWVDRDVRIGRDTIVYPGVVLEGETTVGEESVIGPGCRIVNSWVGSGVELKGWNYLSHTSIRNRAILEPYVRRGYD